MNKFIELLKEHWVSLIFLMIAGNGLVNIFSDKEKWLISAIALLVTGIFWFLSAKVFKLHQRGPIPWYASPVIWLGIPVFIFLLYFFVNPT